MTTSSSVLVPSPAAPPRRRDRFAYLLRQLSAVTVAGALAGLVIGGIGGRLAMRLLAARNPQAAGRVSDDGFVMGQFDIGNTLNLLVIGVGLGLLGSVIYLVLRGLRTGPRWFQVLSLAVGPAVVVGEMLVHTDGVDFRLLQPAELAILLFVLIPGVYAAVLTLLAEHWLRPEAWFMRTSPARAAVPLLLWLVGFPVLPVLTAVLVLWLVQDALRETTIGRQVLGWWPLPWAGRGLLLVLFLLSASRLGDDVTALT